MLVWHVSYQNVSRSDRGQHRATERNIHIIRIKLAWLEMANCTPGKLLPNTLIKGNNLDLLGVLDQYPGDLSVSFVPNIVLGDRDNDLAHKFNLPRTVWRYHNTSVNRSGQQAPDISKCFRVRTLVSLCGTFPVRPLR